MIKKKKNQKVDFSNIEYIITPEMKSLINSLQNCGYIIDLYSYGTNCNDGKRRYICYHTKIIVRATLGEDGYPYEFLFSPMGRKIDNCSYNPAYCQIESEFS